MFVTLTFTTNRDLDMKDSLKPNLSFWQIWNMCFGFFGIQYGFGLQQANLSPIFRYHGAAEHELPKA